jgi:hypothetical protein
MNDLPHMLMSSLSYFKRHFFRISSIILPVLIFIGLYQELMMSVLQDNNSLQSLFMMALLPNLMLVPLYQGAIIFYIAYSMDDRYLKSSQYYFLVLKMLLPCILLMLISSIAIGFGFLLLILPGLYITVRLSYSQIYCFIYQQSATKAFVSSWEATQDDHWLIFKGLLITFVCSFILFFSVGFVLEGAGLNQSVSSFITGIAASLFSIFYHVFIFRVFTANTERLDEVYTQIEQRG